MQDRFMDEVQTWSAEGHTPTGRSGHRISCSESFLYCVGGYNPSCGPLQETWRLNLSTCEWEQISDPSNTPKASVSHCLTSCGRDLLMMGGTSFPFGSLLSSQVEACDVNTGQWRSLGTSGHSPPQLYGQAVRRLGDNMYVVGGTSGYHFSMHAHALHLPTLTWTCLAPHGILKLPVLSLDTGKWEMVKTHPDPLVNAYPSPRRCHAAVQKDTELYVIGGTDGSEVQSDVWKLDLIYLTWTKVNLQLPKPLYFHDAALTKSGYLYVYGGLSSIGSTDRSSTVYRARLDTPPLLEAAWESFTHCPALKTTPSASSTAPTARDLLAAGVPRNLVIRLGNLKKGRASNLKEERCDY
ncbi:Kelch domain-containing protein 10-like 2 [Homarus americanus]|uniref:Kelch domain-containing protein 10 n=1 Tax=Homarus americanus TaxID=6706 RepID=A0A8J5JNZ3_HOMAM|nr:Kelch domain-containing protein 10-like 2 [Homarus americanus]